MDTVDSCVTDCPICFLGYDAARPPLATPCGHSFCRECATKLAGAAPHLSTFTCPLCREQCQPGVQGLRVNAALRALVDEIAAAQRRRERRRSSELPVGSIPSAVLAERVLNAGGGDGRGGAGTPTGRTSSAQGKREFQYNCPRITYDELVLEALIDSGAFGEVHRCRWQGQTVATKVLRCGGEMSPAAVDSFQREVEVMSILHHPNIVLMLGACVEPPRLCLVLELMSGGSLYGLLHCACARLEAVEVRSVALDMAHGLQYLHNLNILHRDLKSKNVLLTRTLPRQAKLCDFGLSRVRMESATMTGNVGTPQWTAPEVLNDSKYRLSADIYSFGMVMLEIVTNKLPFAGKNPMAIIMAVGVKKQRPPIPDNAAPLLRELIDRCTRWEPDERPNMLEVIRILEAYSAPEPAKTSVLYQTMAFCEQQSQPADQNWSVESAIGSLTNKKQVNGVATDLAQLVLDNQAAMAKEQRIEEEDCTDSGTGTPSSGAVAVAVASTAVRNSLAAASFFSPIETQEEDRRNELAGFTTLAADVLCQQDVESSSSSGHGGGFGDDVRNSSSSTLAGSPCVSSQEAEASGYVTAGPRSVRFGGDTQQPQPQAQHQIDADFEMALRLQHEEDEAAARQHTTEYDSMLAQEMLQQERRDASLDTIPPHLLSTLHGGSLDTRSDMVREHMLALEQMAAMSPSASLTRSPARSSPPPPPPLPPSFQQQRYESFGDEAARHVAMKYALEDVEAFPHNQLRTTRTAEYVWKPTVADLTHDRQFNITPTGESPAARSPLGTIHSPVESGNAGQLVPVYPPPLPSTIPVTQGVDRSQVVPVLPPPSHSSSAQPIPPPPPLPPPNFSRSVNPRPFRVRPRLSLPSRTRRCLPQRAYSAVIGDVPKFDKCRLKRSHTVQYSGLPTRSEYTLEKQREGVIARQEEAVRTMFEAQATPEAKAAAASGRLEFTSHPINLFSPKHKVKHMQMIKSYQETLRRVREFRPECLHHVQPKEQPAVLSSGICISQAALTMFAEMKMRKSHKYIGLSVQRATGDRSVSVAFHQAGVGVTSHRQDARWFQSMTHKLPDNEPRFVLFDFFRRQISERRTGYEYTDDGPRDSRPRDAVPHDAGSRDTPRSTYKLVLIFWCPEFSSVGEKMIYASSKQALRQQLGGGVSKEYRIHCRADLDYGRLSAELG